MQTYRIKVKFTFQGPLKQISNLRRPPGPFSGKAQQTLCPFSHSHQHEHLSSQSINNIFYLLNNFFSQ